MRRVLGILGLLFALMSGAVSPLLAQNATGEGGANSAILVLDRDRVFFESDFGKRAQQEINRARSQIATENTRIKQELEEEEKALTDKRAELPAEQFRDLADGFDTKVQRIRQEQATKVEALSTQMDKERELFWKAALPVLDTLMQESGATVILSRRSVLASYSGIDITDTAIARLNETLGSGK